MTDAEHETLEGHVVAVLDNRELLIDIGRAHGVTTGMRFAVLGQVEVVTPQGRAIPVDYPKTIVKIVRFQGDDLAIGRTFRTVPGRKGMPPIDPLRLGSMRPYYEGTPDIPPSTETLQTDEEAVLESRDRTIRAGDVARLTVDDEFRDTL